MPSRIQVKLPADITEQIETARNSYQRCGKLSDVTARWRGSR
ncbi:MAG: hypothetical protein ABSE93_09730 [Terriglobia bacterium]